MQENHIPEYINFCGENWKLLNFTSKRQTKKKEQQAIFLYSHKKRIASRQNSIH